jgi:rod shape-determining protein MreC
MCSVVSYDGTGFQSAFTVDRGTLSGVAVGDCVVGEEGLVGVVTDIGPNYANVATLLSQDVQVGAMIARTRAVAVVVGDFQLSQMGKLKLAYLSNDADVRVGDLVVTTGSSGTYPKGLLVGRVERFALETTGLSSYAVVAPVVDLEHLTGVFVVKDYAVVD